MRRKKLLTDPGGTSQTIFVRTIFVRTQKQMAVRLISSDGVPFELSRKLACMSLLVNSVINQDSDDEASTSELEDSQAIDIPLPNVHSETLGKIVLFFQRHVNNPLAAINKPIKTTNMVVNVGEWDANFIDVDKNTLFALILAANYMDIPSLIDLGCAKVASIVKGKTPEEIRSMFGLVNDLTDDEEQRVRNDNSWINQLKVSAT